MANQRLTAWKLGVQTYTFHRFTLFEAIDKAKQLGLGWIEAYPGQRLRPEAPEVEFNHEAPGEVLDQVLAKLAEAGIAMVNYGVVQPKSDEPRLRGLFDFARRMGVRTITAEPEPEALDTLDGLTREYEINLAIHNHPRPSRYWQPELVLEALAGRSNPRLGACADTGHWQRCDLEPVACLKQLAGRIISLHFKDLNEPGPEAHDVIWGTGVSNVRGMLEELDLQGFAGVFSAEYEYNWENWVPDLEASFKYYREVLAALGRSG